MGNRWRLVGNQWRLLGNRWRLVGNRWRLVGNQWRLVGNRWRLVGNRWRLVGNRWRLVDNRWRLVGNQWRLVGSHQTSASGCHSKKKKKRVSVLMAPPVNGPSPHRWSAHAHTPAPRAAVARARDALCTQYRPRGGHGAAAIPGCASGVGPGAGAWVEVEGRTPGRPPGPPDRGVTGDTRGSRMASPYAFCPLQDSNSGPPSQASCATGGGGN